MTILLVIGVNPLQTTLLQLGIVSGRVALLLRSTEIHPVLLRFVFLNKTPSGVLPPSPFKGSAPGRGKKERSSKWCSHLLWNSSKQVMSSSTLAWKYILSSTLVRAVFGFHSRLSLKYAFPSLSLPLLPCSSLSLPPAFYLSLPFLPRATCSSTCNMGSRLQSA